MEIRITVESTSLLISVNSIENHCVFDFSNRSTDALELCSIDPLDRAGAARLAGMDQDLDRGTTSRDGIRQGFHGENAIIDS